MAGFIGGIKSLSKIRDGALCRNTVALKKRYFRSLTGFLTHLTGLYSTVLNIRAVKVLSKCLKG